MRCCLLSLSHPHIQTRSQVLKILTQLPSDLQSALLLGRIQSNSKSVRKDSETIDAFKYPSFLTDEAVECVQTFIGK